MTDGVEEEEFAFNEGLYEHDGARSDDGQERHDVQDSDNV